MRIWQVLLAAIVGGGLAICALVTSWERLGWDAVIAIFVTASAGAFISILVDWLWSGKALREELEILGPAGFVVRELRGSDGSDKERMIFAQCLVMNMLDREGEIKEECRGYFWDVFDALKGAGFGVEAVFNGNAPETSPDAPGTTGRTSPDLRLLDRQEGR